MIHFLCPIKMYNVNKLRFFPPIFLLLVLISCNSSEDDTTLPKASWKNSQFIIFSYTKKEVVKNENIMCNISFLVPFILSSSFTAFTQRNANNLCEIIWARTNQRLPRNMTLIIDPRKRKNVKSRLKSRTEKVKTLGSR